MLMQMLLLFVCLINILVLQASIENEDQQQPDWSFLNQSLPIFQLDPKFPPLSVTDVIRGLSPHGYRGDVKRVHNVLNKAMHKKSLQVLVIGGSVPYGAGLEPNAYRDSWPTQLKHMLHNIFNIKVYVNNLSIRAVSSDSQATSRFNFIMEHVSAKNVDLVLVDIGLNDKPHNDPEFKEYVAYFEDVTRITDAAKEASLLKERKKQGEGRLLMQLLLRFVPSTAAIMYFETFAGGGKTAPIIHSFQDLVAARKQGLTDGVYDFDEKPIMLDCYPDVGSYYHFQALVEYKIPVFSYPDVVCPIHNKSYWGNSMHHTKEYHHFTAYLLALAIFELAKSDISETKYDSKLPFPVSRITDWNNYVYDQSSNTKLNLDSKLIVCAITPLSYMAVNRPNRFTPVRKGSAWQFYADVRGKPGWIADAIVDDHASYATLNHNQSRDDYTGIGGIASRSRSRSREIVFPITLSIEQPMLRLSFLRSYNKTMGTLSCCISSSSSNSFCTPDTTNIYVFDGHWSDMTSQGVAVPVHLNNVTTSTDLKSSSLSDPNSDWRKQSNSKYKYKKTHKINSNDMIKKKQESTNSMTVTRNVVCTADKGKFKIIGVVGC